MTNLEKLNKIFCEVFSVEESVLNSEFDNKSVDGWDSVHQLTLISIFEEAFDIMFDPEDIMEMTSYAKGKELLQKYEVEL